MSDLEIAGRLVRLRPLTIVDREAIGAVLAEPEVAGWWVHDDHATTLAGLFDDDEDEVRYAIEVDGVVAGMIQFSEEAEPDYRHASIDLRRLPLARSGYRLTRSGSWRGTCSKRGTTIGSRSTRLLPTCRPSVLTKRSASGASA